MTEAEAIKICKNIVQQNKEIVRQTRKNNDTNAMQLTANCDTESIAIETLIAELEKKDKIIDLMAKSFKQDDIRTVEEIKQYFEKKAEEKERC